MLELVGIAKNLRQAQQARCHNELDSDLDDNPNLAIFRQTDNGLLVRMALFAMVLDVVNKVEQYSYAARWYKERQN